MILKKHALLIASLCFFTLFAISFNLSWRYPPYVSFYTDMVVCLSALVIFLVFHVTKKLTPSPPKVSWYLLLVSIVFLVQPVFVEVIYVANHLRAAGLFFIMALLAWATASYSQNLGLDVLLKRLCWFLVVGCILQSAVFLLQIFSGEASLDWLLAQQSGGQLGQRNLMGHYLMWGLLASVYLIVVCVDKHRILAILAVVFLLAVLGLVGSRTVLLYTLLVSLAGLLTLWRVEYETDKSAKVFAIGLISTSLALIAAQWGMTKLVAGLVTKPVESGLLRAVASHSDSYRLLEWQKAWQMFTERPIYGYGFDSYPYQSFLKDAVMVDETFYQRPDMFHHAHNAVLQIGAELGLIGIGVIFVGLILLLRSVNWKQHTSQKLLLISFLIITLCHSMLEYPLWHTQFLAIAILFLTLLSYTSPKFTLGSNAEKAIYIFSFGVAFTILLGMVSTLLLNQFLITKYLSKSQGIVAIWEVRRDAMYILGKKNPLLNMYYEQGLLLNTNPVTTHFSNEKMIQLDRVRRLRPAAYALNLYALGLYKTGDIDGSKELLKLSWKRYPRELPKFSKFIFYHKADFPDLLPITQSTCNKYKGLKIYSEFSESSCLNQLK